MNHIPPFQVEPNKHAPNEVVFDSDASESESSDDEDANELDFQPQPHKDPNSYAWLLLRFACVVQFIENLKRFLSVSGFELAGGQASLSIHLIGFF